jgi:hypothetical protein
MDMSTNGKFIMSCSNKNDLVLYDLRGDVITRTDTCQMTTYAARSPLHTYTVRKAG